MDETLKQNVARFLVPAIASIASSVVVGVGATFLTIWMMTEKLDTRVNILEEAVHGQHLIERASHLEVQIERHEKALDRDFARHEATVADIAHKTDDQEKRLTRLEALFTETQAMLSEIRTDVKILLRGGQQ